MPQPQQQPDQIKLYGKRITPTLSETESEGEYFSVKEVFEISSGRDSAEEHIVDLKEDEAIELVLEDQTVWFGDKNSLVEIFPELQTPERSVNNIVILPSYIEPEEESRGLFGNIAIKLFKIFSKKAIGKQVAKIAANLEEKLLEGRSGLYRLTPDFDYIPNPKIDPSVPVLILIHGTAASTAKSFKDLKDSSLWTAIQNQFSENVYCFEHESLTKSPFQNTLELVKQLPSGTKLHLLTTSRGGLIGELIVRFSENFVGFPPEVFTLLHNKNRKEDLDTIKAISFQFKDKQITVERFVRIACPGRGTSLMSNRVDFFLNVMLNFLVTVSGPLAPVVETLKALISSALSSKNDPSLLPGLEVQNPKSVFNKALNSPNFNGGILEGFNNQLYVISGNAKPSFSLKGLWVLLMKLVFLRQNDMVVDTASMYQGAFRKKPIQFFFDEGKEVNHFSYFKNNPTIVAIESALLSDLETLPTFATKKLGLEEEGERGILGIQGGRLFPEKLEGNKPIIILLPGIMGSALEQDKTHIWLNYFQIPIGALERIEINQKDVEATSLIRSAYVKLFNFLRDDYDVLLFPFDWRKSVAEAGEQLSNKIQELLPSRQPIKIIAHSMGGLVVRELIIKNPDLWSTLNKQKDFRFLMLGTPWTGSYRIPHVLSGRDVMLKQINTLDFKHSDDELVDMFSKYPGLLNLLPVRGNDIDFSNKKIWNEFQVASSLQWKVPGKELLEEFIQFKKNVLESIGNIDYTNIFYVAGKSKKTPNSYKIENGKIVFDYTSQGDESVTWESGIPTGINRDTNLFYVNVSHGSLASKEILFRGIKEILETGNTGEPVFGRRPPLDEQAVSRAIVMKEEFVFEQDKNHVESAILGLDYEKTEDVPQKPILKISVTNGDLVYSSAPLLLGHFAKDGILNAEAVADKYMSQALSLQHSFGFYPELIGSSQLFLPDEAHWFAGCIVAGLGQAEFLTAQQLMTTIEKAVVNYLLRYWRHRSSKQEKPDEKITLSSLLIGADYGGLSIETSCRAIMQGVANANSRFTGLIPNRNIYIHELEFVELFEDKAVQCFLSIDKLMSGNNDNLNISWNSRRIKQTPGARKRLLGDSSADWWQRLSVLGKDTDEKTGRPILSFYSSTNTARELNKDLYTGIEIVESLLTDISIRKNWSFDKSRAIFELLIPNEFKESIRRNAPVLWVLDNYTAGFPWELLQTGTNSDRPLCVTAGMIRQLAIKDYDLTKSSQKTNQVLVIGDPNLNNLSGASQLSGAKREAETVHQLFQGYDLDLNPLLVKSDPDEIITALFKHEYKIVHIAAHGIFNEQDPKQSGVIIGRKIGKDEPLLLTPNEFEKLPCPPEFVFVNCCHLGRVSLSAEVYSSNRFRLAANIGTQLIKMGVKAVIVTGWEVDDAAAEEFAGKFYKQMLDSNSNFGEAVRIAREHIYTKYKYSNTWGAYQCYGDPHYKFSNTNSRGGQKNESVKKYKIPQQIENDLDSIISKAQIRFYDQNDLLKKLDKLSMEIAALDDGYPEIIEKQATAYVELGKYDIARATYEKLFKMNKASYDVRSLERVQEISSRQMLKNFEKDKIENAPKYIKEVKIAIKNLVKLKQISVTARRNILLAELNKRCAFMVSSGRERLLHLSEASECYRSATSAGGSTGLFAYCNWMIMEKLLKLYQAPNKNSNKAKQVPVYSKAIEHIKSELAREDKKETDEYWKMLVRAQAYVSIKILAPSFDLEEATDKFRQLWELTASYQKRDFQLEYIDLLIHFFGQTKRNSISSDLKKLRDSVVEGKSTQ